MEHFDDFNWLDNYKILSCEEKRKYDLNGLPFVSIADLEVETIDKKLAILDHKISTTFKKSDLKSKLKQLYIYSYSFRDKHGQLPDELIFNHFKNNEIVHHEFNKQEYEYNINWLINKIEFISKQTEFLPRCELLNDKQKKSDFYAIFLCGHRKTCPFRLFKKEHGN